MNNNKKLLFLALLFFLLVRCSDNGSSINGTVIFSDAELPEVTMNVYAKNIKSGEVFVTHTTQKNNSFKITKIPDGKYIVYAYSKDEVGEYVLPKKIKLYGGYSKAVLCGSTEKCTDHELIKIEIKNGQEINNIKISDWFEAEVPNE